MNYCMTCIAVRMLQLISLRVCYLSINDRGSQGKWQSPEQDNNSSRSVLRTDVFGFHRVQNSIVPGIKEHKQIVWANARGNVELATKFFENKDPGQRGKAYTFPAHFAFPTYEEIFWNGNFPCIPLKTNSSQRRNWANNRDVLHVVNAFTQKFSKSPREGKPFGQLKEIEQKLLNTNGSIMAPCLVDSFSHT